jgi:hypothetical protein
MEKKRKSEASPIIEKKRKTEEPDNRLVKYIPWVHSRKHLHDPDVLEPQDKEVEAYKRIIDEMNYIISNDSLFYMNEEIANGVVEHVIEREYSNPTIILEIDNDDSGTVIYYGERDNAKVKAAMIKYARDNDMNVSDDIDLNDLISNWCDMTDSESYVIAHNI